MALQLVPTPSGQVPFANQVVHPDASLSTVVGYVAKQYGTAKAAQFLQWYEAAVKQDPSLTPLNGATIFLTGSTIANNLGTATGALATIPSAAAAGANSAYKDILGGFNLGNWFLRIGEILLGLVLVGVGLARITGAQNFISQAVKARVP